MKNFEFFLYVRESACLAKELWNSYVKHPKEVDRAKAKEPSMHQIELGNESGVFTTETKKRTNRKGFHHTKLSKLNHNKLKGSNVQTYYATAVYCNQKNLSCVTSPHPAYRGNFTALFFMRQDHCFTDKVEMSSPGLVHG